MLERGYHAAHHHKALDFYASEAGKRILAAEALANDGAAVEARTKTIQAELAKGGAIRRERTVLIMTLDALSGASELWVDILVASLTSAAKAVAASKGKPLSDEQLNQLPSGCVHASVIATLRTSALGSPLSSTETWQTRTWKPTQGFSGQPRAATFTSSFVRPFLMRFGPAETPWSPSCARRKPRALRTETRSHPTPNAAPTHRVDPPNALRQLDGLWTSAPRNRGCWPLHDAGMG